MLSTSNTIYDEDGSVGYIESIYFSDNVLKSTYFPKTRMLYIAFNRGGMYSYCNVSQELYDEFEQAESQGEFFYKKINKKSEFPYRKEFTLYPEELTEIKNKRNNIITDENNKS
jgi:hypothetical protein